MKTRIIFCVYVALLPLMVNSFKPLSYFLEKVRKISDQKGGMINNVFEPKEYIESGRAGFAFKGLHFGSSERRELFFNRSNKNKNTIYRNITSDEVENCHEIYVNDSRFGCET